MRQIPAIKSVMTAFPYSVDVNQTINHAQQFLRQHNISHLPVTNRDELLGVVSQRDLNFYLLYTGDEVNSIVGDIPMGQKHAVDLNERLDHVLQDMADNHIDSTLVTRQGRLVGIFTHSDVCRSFARYLADQFSPPSGDEAA